MDTNVHLLLWFINVLIKSLWVVLFHVHVLQASKYNKGFPFLLCIIDVVSKYAWAVPSKDKKSIEITNTFQNFLDESNHTPNKIRVDKASNISNGSTKSLLQVNEWYRNVFKT